MQKKHSNKNTPLKKTFNWKKTIQIFSKMLLIFWKQKSFIYNIYFAQKVVTTSVDS